MSQQEQANNEQHIINAQNITANTNVNNGQVQSNGPFDATVASVDNVEAKTDESQKKTDEPQKIKRPMNPFMIFGCEKRRKLAQVHPRMHNSEISKILGAEWKRMSEYEKAPYVQEAKRLKEQHSIEYPNYKFKANRRKPRQQVKKERPTFPYAADLNAIPTAMKFPYPSPFFQDSMYGSMYPAMAGSSHPAYSLYSGGDYSSALARQAMVTGSVVRGAQPPSTTGSASAEYYPLNKASNAPINDYYSGVVSNKSSDYYSAMHSAAAAGTRTERTAPGGEVVNLAERYPAADNRTFENRYSTSFNGSQGSTIATYSTMQATSHLSTETPAAYSYSSLYDQRH
uniref:Sex-determining region Y protein n=1 Tax=Hydractinia echinata TaxID=3283270 RepID=A0A1P8KZZ9_HYDEC|nr:Sox24 [Hydractinia echinata]